ncbi:MAG: phosphoribosyltransferase [Candidatus Thorarchaeota archaeon]|nr:phosphoribosyltransferase [Candidatus Thorarchaeota archaeon]
MEYLILGWQDIYNLTLQLSERIVESEYEPNVIVGIARGGWIPARILSDVLYTQTMWNVRIEYYTDVGVRGRQPRVTQPLSVSLEGKNILLVDEVADTGESLFHAIKHVEELGVSNVRTAVLHLKPSSMIKPDYYMQEVTSWIVYPWEIRESIIAIVREFRREDPDLSLKQIRNRLVFKVGFDPTVADYFIKRL